MHGALDGFLRVVVFLCCSTNYKVARFMLNADGVERSHVLRGLCVHN